MSKYVLKVAVDLGPLGASITSSNALTARAAAAAAASATGH